MSRFMHRSAMFALAAVVLTTPAFAASYPVQGKWGQSSSTDKKPVDCKGLRTIDFQGERRFDSGGSIPDLRAISVEPQGQNTWRITEQFRTGQVNGRNRLTLRAMSDPDRVELQLSPGGTVRLRKCA